MRNFLGTVLASDLHTIEEGAEAVVVFDAERDGLGLFQSRSSDVESLADDNGRVKPSHVLESGGIVIVSVAETGRAHWPRGVVKLGLGPGQRWIGKRFCPWSIAPGLTGIDDGVAQKHGRRDREIVDETLTALREEHVKLGILRGSVLGNREGKLFPLGLVALIACSPGHGKIVVLFRVDELQAAALAVGPE